jgi:hypothetical protein
MIELIQIAPHPTPLTCALCREQFRVSNGPWPATPSPTRAGAYKLVCLSCASVEEPAKDYGADWQLILDGIAEGRFAESDEVAIDKALAAIEKRLAGARKP